MPLQNRVTPFSTIEADSARGLFMGNRGCLHDDARNLTTQGWRSSLWIICALRFKDRQRSLMQPRRYTELFFLDEAVALAAGHRPCAECRRPAYTDFITGWSRLSGAVPRASALDAALHSERVARIRKGQRHVTELGRLPGGAFVVLPDAPSAAWLTLGGRVLLWSHAGYVRAEDWAASRPVAVLTPPSTLFALRAGYRPVVHPSAENF